MWQNHKNCYKIAKSVTKSQSLWQNHKACGKIIKSVKNKKMWKIGKCAKMSWNAVKCLSKELHGVLCSKIIFRF